MFNMNKLEVQSLLMIASLHFKEIKRYIAGKQQHSELIATTLMHCKKNSKGLSIIFSKLLPSIRILQFSHSCIFLYYVHTGHH